MSGRDDQETTGKSGWVYVAVPPHGCSIPSASEVQAVQPTRRAGSRRPAPIRCQRCGDKRRG